MEKCHLCGNETDYTCETCGHFMCNDCQAPFTMHNQIDYNCCLQCCDARMDTRNEWLEQLDKERQVEENILNDKKTKRSNAAKKAAMTRNTPEYKKKQIEKKKVEQNKQAEVFAKVLSTFFKN